MSCEMHVANLLGGVHLHAATRPASAGKSSAVPR